MKRTTNDAPTSLKCPKCGSTKTTIEHSYRGQFWCICEDCKTRFSSDAETGDNDATQH